MKQKFLMAIGAVLLIALMAGCSRDEQSASDAEAAANMQESLTADMAPADKADEPAADNDAVKESFDLKDVEQAANIREILKMCDTVSYTRMLYDGSGEALSTEEKHFFMVDDNICTNQKYVMGDAAPVYSCDYIGKGIPGATYTSYVYEDGKTYHLLDIYPAAEYEDFASDWLDTGGCEWIDCVSRDGAVIVSARRDYSEIPDIYDMNYYEMDPGTGRLMTVNKETRDAGTGEVITRDTVSLKYDETYEPDYGPVYDILAEDEGVWLTVAVKTSLEETEIQTFWICPGTFAGFYSGSAYQIFSDPECTREVDDFGMIYEDAEFYVMQ